MDVAGDNYGTPNMRYPETKRFTQEELNKAVQEEREAVLDEIISVFLECLNPDKTPLDVLEDIKIKIEAIRQRGN